MEDKEKNTKKFVLKGIHLFLTYQIPKKNQVFDVNYYFNKEEVLKQLTDSLNSQNIEIDKFLICFESNKYQITETKGKEHFQSISDGKHIHVYLELKSKIQCYDPFLLDLVSLNQRGETIKIHGNYQTVKNFINFKKPVLDNQQSSDVKKCLSYLLKEDIEPYSNIPFSELEKIRKKRNTGYMVYDHQLEPLKLYQANEDDIKIKKNIIQFPKEKIENDFHILKNYSRMCMILPYQQNKKHNICSYVSQVFPEKKIKLVDTFNFFENISNNELLILINMEENDIPFLLTRVLENQVEEIQWNHGRFKIPSDVIIIILKERIMNNNRILDFLKQNAFLNIVELDSNFNIIQDPTKQIINITINNTINNNYSENKEIFKKLKELEKNNILLNQKIQILEQQIKEIKNQSSESIEKEI